MTPQVYKEKESNLEYLKIDNNSKTAIILFHGYGASMYDLYGIGETVQNKNKFDWIFPNGFLPLEMGFMLMARAWFPIDMKALEQAMQAGTHRDFSNIYTEDFEKALSRGHNFIESFKQSYDSLIIGGFSQGAMIASHLALKNSDSISKLVCFSGALIGKEQMIKLLESSKKFPFFQSHGKQDPVLGYAGAMELFELLKLGGHQGEFVGFDGAHEIPINVINKFETFIER